MSTLCLALLYLAAGSLGVFAGAMLTEAGVLVPFWRSLPPGEFLTWYRQNGQLLLRYFSPVTSVSAAMALAAAGASFWQGHPGRWYALASAVLALSTVASFFVYFAQANARFATGAVPLSQVSGELARWAVWHGARTLLSMCAFASSLLALRSWHP